MAGIKSADKEASNHGQVNKRSIQWDRVKDKESCLQKQTVGTKEGHHALDYLAMEAPRPKKELMKSRRMNKISITKLLNMLDIKEGSQECALDISLLKNNLKWKNDS